MKRGPVVAAVAAALALGGCGGATAPPGAAPRPAQPAAFDGCLAPGPHLRLVKLRAPGELLPAVVIGRGGATGVVFANPSSTTACAWLPYARELARGGVQALLFDYGSAGMVEEIAAGGRWLRAHGARRVVLTGASIGGRAVVEAAARGHADGVATLSAERLLGNKPDLLPAARRLRVPALWISSENDGYTSFGSETRTLYRAARRHARPDLLLVVPGSEHGTSLLSGAGAGRVQRALTRFVHGPG